MPLGFRKAKSEVIDCLRSGYVSHEQRNNIDVKNLLATGAVSTEEVVAVILRARGGDYSCSPHDFNNGIMVHLIKAKAWYIKWYFLEPDAVFISVHN